MIGTWTTTDRPWVTGPTGAVPSATQTELDIFRGNELAVESARLLVRCVRVSDITPKSLQSKVGAISQMTESKDSRRREREKRVDDT